MRIGKLHCFETLVQSNLEFDLHGVFQRLGRARESDHLMHNTPAWVAQAYLEICYAHYS